MAVTLAQLEALAARAPESTRPTSQRTGSDEALGAGKYSTLDVVTWFQSRGHYGRPGNKAGKHCVLCPWASEHSDTRGAEASDTVVLEADGEQWPTFHCSHEHCSGRTLRTVMELWGDADQFCSELFDTAVFATDDLDQDTQLRPNEALLSSNRESLHYPYHTDLGNAERLAHRFGETIRYCPQRGTWLNWGPGRWVEDQTFEIERKAQQTVRAIYLEAANGSDKDERSAANKWAHKSEAAERIAAMIRLTRSQPGIAVSVNDFDRDPWLFNCLNGTIDLRTGNLRPHSQADLITKISPVFFDPRAKAPTFRAFLKKILGDDDGLVDYLQRVVGFCLTGVPPDRVMWFLHGNGRNGKSTLLDILHHLFAGYARKAAADTFLARKFGDGISTDLAHLAGARLAFASEMPENCQLNESRIKDITGREIITARFLHKDHFQFEPTFKLFMYGNHRPIVRGTDNGIWDRLKLIPFNVRISDEEVDTQLPHRLRQEMGGILTWAVEGCLEYQRNGFQHPQSVQERSKEYRDEQDALGAFINDCCLEPQDELQVANGVLWTAYERWCRRNGERRPVSRTQFKEQLEKRGFEQANSRAIGGRYWKGLAIDPARIPNEDELSTDDLD